MKHTTTRKKMLLSSVAMLLVAMMALGTATFAWFTTNPTVTATGVKMQVNTSTGLKTMSVSMQKYNADSWGKTAYLNSNAEVNGSSTTKFTVDPVSGINDTFFTTTAATDNKFEKAADANVTSATPYQFNEGGGIGTTGAFYSEKVFVKPEGDVDSAAVTLSNVNIAWGNTAIAKAARVAILNQAGSTVAVFAPTSNGNATTYVTGTANSTTMTTGTYSTGEEGTTDDDVFQTIASGTDTTKEIALGTFGSAGTDGYTVIAYLDGEDSNCYTDNATSLQDLVTNISLTVKADL